MSEDKAQDPPSKKEKTPKKKSGTRTPKKATKKQKEIPKKQEETKEGEKKSELVPKPEIKEEEPKKEEEKEEPPKRPELSEEQIEEISKKVEIPTDQTPPYKPKHVLSPEFGGTSNYEVAISTVREELEQKLKRLRGDPDTNPKTVHLAEEDLKTLDYLYENYNIGMNVFRTARGGRDKLRE